MIVRTIAGTVFNLLPGEDGCGAFYLARSRRPVADYSTDLLRIMIHSLDS